MQRLKFAVGLVAFWIVSTLGGLVLAATALPLVTGWDRVVLTSGSMQPLIDPGDIVLTQQASHPLAPGTVVVFKNPNKPGALITHRVIENLPDGSYRTKGDANAQADVSPVTPENVVGRGAMLVPVIGRPAIWVQQGYPTLAGAAAVVVLLLCWLSRYGLLSKYDPWLNQERTAPSENLRPRKTPGRRVSMTPGKKPWAGDAKSTAVALGALVLSLALVTVAALVMPPRLSTAAFTAHTSNSGNVLKVPCTSPLTVIATVDTYVTQNSQNGPNAPTEAGRAPELYVASHSQDQRTFLRFPLSAVPKGCTIATAKLRLYSKSSEGNRTIQAVQVVGDWNDTSTTWSNKPPTAAASTAATSPSGSGEREWTVTEQTREMAAFGEVNLQLNDSDETSRTNYRQVYSSLEGANPPKLELTLH